MYVVPHVLITLRVTLLSYSYAPHRSRWILWFVSLLFGGLSLYHSAPTSKTAVKCHCPLWNQLVLLMGIICFVIINFMLYINWTNILKCQQVRTAVSATCSSAGESSQLNPLEAGPMRSPRQFRSGNNSPLHPEEHSISVPGTL